MRRPSKRERMHLWVASHQAAAAGDDDAATRYTCLAERATDPAARSEYLVAAEASRKSAAENRDLIRRRMNGLWRPSAAERALDRHFDTLQETY